MASEPLRSAMPKPVMRAANRLHVRVYRMSTMLQTAVPMVNRLPLRLAMTNRVVIGTFLGLGWGASMRAWMAILAMEFGETSKFTWLGTFGAILLPAAVVGAILGGAAYVAETMRTTRWRWAILSPLLLALAPAIATKDFISTLVTTGIGGGAIGVALIGLSGGYAVSGFGARWSRRVAGLLALSLSIATAGTFYFTNGASTSGARRAFGALLFTLLAAWLVAGVSAPSRYGARNKTKTNDL